MKFPKLKMWMVFLVYIVLGCFDIVNMVRSPKETIFPIYITIAFILLMLWVFIIGIDDKANKPETPQIIISSLDKRLKKLEELHNDKI